MKSVSFWDPHAGPCIQLKWLMTHSVTELQMYAANYSNLQMQDMFPSVTTD